MKIDVHGGTGFIGSKFCEMYRDEVSILPRSQRISGPNILYLISTTDNYNVLNSLHVDIDTNLTILMEVLDMVKTLKDQYDTPPVINFVSSWFVYGECPLPARETYPCNPKGFYSITKKCAEDLLISFCNTFKINYRILRLANVYGPGDKGVSKKKNALQYLIDEIKANRDVELYNGGNFVRDYIYVDDVCRGIKLCMEQGPMNEIINIGSGIPYTFKTIIDHVIRRTNYTGKVVAVEPSEFHKTVQVKDFYMDIRNLKKIGFRQQYNVVTGLEQLL
jgi:nucleoside-diphosphate-sugar epimerase